jgi:LacI family transcriptional regulator
VLSLPDPPDSFFCANSRNTVGAFRAISASGTHQALAGFDDFEMADILGLPLVVVAYDPEELGRQAARLLLDRMDRDPGETEGPARRVVVPTNVVEYGMAAEPVVGG